MYRKMKGDLGKEKRVELFDPKNDFAFYWLFGRKEETRFIKDFLSALFNEEITEIKHLDPEYRGNTKDDKEMNVLVKTPDKYVNIEMQRTKRDNMFYRALYYWTEVFGEQKFKKYKKLEKVVTVSILDYVKFKQFHEYHNCHSPCLYLYLYKNDFLYKNDLSKKVEKLTDVLVMDKFEIHSLELPKIELDIGKNRLLDWLIFFRYYNNREVMKDLLETNKVIKAAVDELNKMQTDPEALKLYEAARKRELDYKSAISAAERRGMQRGIRKGIQLGIQLGIQKGIQKGIQRGIQLGIQEGIQLGRQLVINNMLEKGYTLDKIQEIYTLDEIQEITGVTKAQIKELQEKAEQKKKAEQINKVLAKKDVLNGIPGKNPKKNNTLNL